MSSTANEPIAIVGMGCRFAGDATSPSKLWDLLSSPREVAQDIPPTRFNISRFYHPVPTHHGTTATKQAYLLSEDVRLFDTKFFAVPPAESEVIDPQQRQLLEVVYEALESAGLAYEKLAGSDTACFVGLMSQEYFALQGQDVNMVRTYAGTGTAASNASSRVSYFFDWHGPCMTIDTACSSSMVGVNEAVGALRNGSSRVAVACGTNLVLSPLSFITLSKLNMLSPTGRCRMWDADADGYARGEGVAAIVLKTLSSALEDGDEVLSVIREIGVNHDGRTKGLTMPSAAAQAALIRQTYAKAGLDLSKRADRCQFFEAHGTGTAVGDPQEAEAISSAMFPPESGSDSEEILVGSIKTVVGHTEGTAGVAGLIKTTLALREGIVPPNLLFNRLNPALEPFVSHLRIPTSPEPWPEVLEGGVRRASVNSFGFGGSNAHVILESFAGNTSQSSKEKDEDPSTFSVPVPFVFSAASKSSLSTLIEGIVGYLDQHTGNDEVVDMSALAYTLTTKRSTLSQRVAIPAVSLDQLRQRIKANLEADDDYAVQAISSGTTDAPCLLGVFTGQGAQWPAMGANLVATVPMAREILRQLDSSLITLPADHRPDWTLTHALSKNDDENTDTSFWQSRVNEAAFSQPLCTAVQVILVDLLRAAGVNFRAVVGHSSGEIAAAYAAGFLTARDAIRVAYYRGFFATKLAVGLGGKMLAVGTSLEDAEELCQLDKFAGKLSVAAHNAPSSVTLSGDAEAVVRAEAVFLEEKKFARVLRVNTAYHSHHMMVCADAYSAALIECGVQALKPAEGDDTLPQWFSSVYSGRQVGSSTELNLGSQYWVDNMTRPVLFYTAIETCLTAGTFGTDNTIVGVVEVGPHPALQAPATESILQVCGKELPYSGTLRRGQNDVESFSQVLGYLWTRFGPSCVNLGRFQEECQRSSSLHDNGSSMPVRTLHDLPSYPWNHDRVLWAESRLAKLFSKNPGRPHDLLGLDMAEGTVEEMRWRNVLKINELKWLAGHSLQGQIVFPATAYIAIAMEAAMQMAAGSGGAETPTSVRSIDVLDLKIPKAIALNDSGTELVTSMTHIKRQSGGEPGEDVITAEFNAFSTTGKEATSMALNCTARIRIKLGVNSNSSKPDQKGEAEEELEEELETTTRRTWSSPFVARVAPQGSLSAIDVDRFYQVLRDDFGFGYDGAFHGLTSIHRKTNYATATIRNPAFEEGETPLLFHPGMLDSALQGLNAAYSAPGDGRLWSIVAPTSVRRITLVPDLCGDKMTDEVLIDCTITDPRPNCVTGDVNVYLSYPCEESEESGTGSNSITKQCIEVEGITFSPFAAATKDDDRLLFQEAFLTLDKPDATVIYGDRKATPWEQQKALDAERAAFFYLKNLHVSVDAERRAELPWYRRALLSNAERIYNRVKDGQHPFVPPEWISDTREDVIQLMDAYGSDDADFNLTRAVGENLTLPAVLNGESSILEHMTQNNYLEKYYTDAIGFDMLNGLISGVADQLCNKYPHMRMLEVGGGTGGATQAIFGRIGDAFASYTYTDISSAFFGYAAQRFTAQAHKMVFKTLDISEDPTAQGFKKHSYDVVFASNVLHATESLRTSVEHARQLLRPGGYLVMVEIIRNDVLRHGLVMGGLPGWWVGEKDGRIGGPSITLEEWDTVLRETGFDGIETNSPMLDPVGVPGAVIVAQASTEQVQTLKNPLTANPTMPIINRSSRVATATGTDPTLVLLGSDKKSPSSSASFLSSLCNKLSSLLQPHFSQIIHLPRLEDHDSIVSRLPKEDVHVISLIELEGENVFEDTLEPAFLGLKALLSPAATVLWLLAGDGGDNPYAGITVGLFRTLFFELPGTLLQTLDLGTKVDGSDDKDTVAKLSSMVAELSLRLRTLGDMARSGGTAHEGNSEVDGAIGEKEVLWNFEPELVLDESGRLRVPRVRPQDEQNARYNSAKRQITKVIDMSDDRDTVLEVRRAEASYVLQELHEFDRLGNNHDDVCIVRVSCSLLSTVKTPAGFVFVSYGTDVNTGEKRLCFSDKNASTVTMPPSWTVTVENNSEVDVEGLDVQFMMFVTADLLAQRLLGMLPPVGTVLAYEPDPIISNLLTRELGRRGRKAVFVTSNPELYAQRPDWVYLHTHRSKRDIDEVIPPDVTLYVDAASMGNRDDGKGNDGLGSHIAHSLPRICDRISLSSLLADEASPLLGSPTMTDSNDIGNTAPESITRLLHTATSNALKLLGSIYDWEPLDILSLPQVVSPLARPKPNSLVYWPMDRPVAVSVAPVLQWRQDLFRPDRTYWLAGLSGDVGRSMADFMVENGARYVALSSRTPKVEEGWVAWHKKRGATISYFSGDVTNWGSVNQTYHAITRNMPPISGVANGAMVLRDVSLITMSFEDFVTVLRPKVQGTLNLDRLFSSSQRELDFFICFSSIAGTLGNPGQSAYSAGNCFMKSLVRRRRNRGLPGAAIDIGRLVGVGYIERESSGRLTKEHQTRLQTRSGAVPMSETDLHQLFAEAIIAGRPSSSSSSSSSPQSYSDSSELISSIVPITTEQAKQAYWSSNPRLGLLIREMGQQLSGSVGSGSGNAVPVRQLLNAAKTMGQVESILLATFKAKLQALKFLPDADSIYDATPLVEMGVDSLVAVEMRSWFLKELGVDVPVMTILGGASIADLVRLVVEKLPAELLERVGGSGGPSNVASDPLSAASPSMTTDEPANGSEEASSSNESTSGSVGGLEASEPLNKADTDISSVGSVVDEKVEEKPVVPEVRTLIC